MRNGTVPSQYFLRDGIVPSPNYYQKEKFGPKQNFGSKIFFGQNRKWAKKNFWVGKKKNKELSGKKKMLGL